MRCAWYLSCGHTCSFTGPGAHPQIEFMPKCDAVAIMDEGRCLYFGRWNEEAQTLLGKLLPITHLLHAAGSQEAPPAPKKEAAKGGVQKS